jgi:hypothetical protein
MPIDDADADTNGSARVIAARARARRGDPAAWLADEVAIDFPSVGPVVERMRDAFWGASDGENDQALLAEVELSARQAFNGATIPLDVPVRATCPRCGGRGETWTEACPPCGGSGQAVVRHLVNVFVPARVTDGASFRFSITAPHALPTRIEVRVAIR